MTSGSAWRKSTFCIDRVDDGLEDGLTPGKDWSATPACSAACIASAIKFGDFNDPNSEVSKLTAEGNYFQMHAELGNDPQIKYLYETPSVPGRDAQETEMNDEALTEPDNPLTGQAQTYWDLRAAMNFIMGRIWRGPGYNGHLMHLGGGLNEMAMFKMFTGAGVIIAIGLFCLAEDWPQAESAICNSSSAIILDVTGGLCRNHSLWSWLDGLYLSIDGIAQCS